MRRPSRPPRSRSCASTARCTQLGEEVADLRDETTLLERRDEATGLYNSRHFVEALTREIERSRTYGRPLALALASVETTSAGRRRRAAERPARAGRRDRRQRAGDRPGLPRRLDRVRGDHARDRHQGRPRSRPSACCARSPGPAARAIRQPQAAVGIAACPAHAETFEELIERAGSALRSAREAVREESASKPGTVTVSMAVWDDVDE